MKIGWRPYLLTALALLVLAVAVLDVSVSAGSPSCATPDALLANQLLAQARQQYTSLLEQNPTSVCAKEGLARTTDEQCARANALARIDPAEARTELEAIAGDPKTHAGSCVWTALNSLPVPASTG